MKTFVALLISFYAIASGGTDMIPNQEPSGKPASEQKAVSYQIAPAPYPNEVQSALKEIRQDGGHKVVQSGNTTYVAIGLGQRPTGGYSVVVDSVERSADGSVVIRVSEKAPAPGSITTQSITYPTIVLSLANTSGTVRVEFT